MPNRLRRSDVSDPDFLDATELAADGSAAYKDSVSVTSTTASTKTVVISGWNLKDPDDPVEAGDTVILTGDAAGTYTVATVESATNLTVVESIIDSTGGTAEFRHPPGASRIGFDNTSSGLTADDVQAAIDEIVDGGGGGAPINARYLVGAANPTLTLEVVKPQILNFDPDTPPSSPSAWDDEFEGGGSLDDKWTVNDPGSTGSPNQTTFEGFLHCDLAELGSAEHTFDYLIRLAQTPPSYDTTWRIKAKVAISAQGLAAEIGEWAGIGLYLADNVNDDMVAVENRISDNPATYLATEIVALNAFFTHPTSHVPQKVTPTEWIYIALEKTTANAYTSANTYRMLMSRNGMTWWEIGNTSKTFASACNEFGIYFRRPKYQTGTPADKGLADFFRKENL